MDKLMIDPKDYLTDNNNWYAKFTEEQLMDATKSRLTGDLPVLASDYEQTIEELQRDNERLRKALWYISVNSMPPGDDWCEVPERVSRYAGEALSDKESSATQPE